MVIFQILFFQIGYLRVRLAHSMNHSLKGDREKMSVTSDVTDLDCPQVTERNHFEISLLHILPYALPYTITHSHSHSLSHSHTVSNTLFFPTQRTPYPTKRHPHSPSPQDHTLLHPLSTPSQPLSLLGRLSLPSLSLSLLFLLLLR